MPAGNFHSKLELNEATGVVSAHGPLDPAVTSVIEVCVWVFQRNGTHDTTVNFMTSGGMAGMVGGLALAFGDAGRWAVDLLPVPELLSVPEAGSKLSLGPAFGAAVALVTVKADVAGDPDEQRALVWGEPVELI
jgi:hypothetical protein